MVLVVLVGDDDYNKVPSEQLQLLKVASSAQGVINRRPLATNEPRAADVQGGNQIQETRHAS